jgi:predicted DNA-binding transcriptional regulator AlpA
MKEYMSGEFPSTGFLRVDRVLFFFPVSESTWHTGVRNGLYPKPVKLSKNVSGWKAEDIKALIDRIGNLEAGEASA